MTHPFRATMALVAGLVAYGSAAHAQGDPPGRVGRLAFAEGSVSFHDRDDSAWSKAVVNTPLTSGDSVWTEPNAHSELSIAGTRLRLDGGTQLDVQALDDGQSRLQLVQGRLDLKVNTLDTRTPFQIVTPRGTITLQQPGDYYVEAGSTEDATRLGVRSGSAQIKALNGQTLTVQAGQVGEILGNVGALQLRTVNSAPPAMPAYWAARDRQVTYDPPTQYLSGSMTGYEDLNTYGSWSNDSQYGNVWTPRSVPSDWQPYRTGHWSNVKPWGWTWIDDQPWGYAPYHYGRWANRDNRWVWVPPQRDVQPVYAPALVAFIGGIELSVSLGNQSNAPVGWFPLGPRETYVPSYTADRDYYNRINRSAQIQQNVLDDRWQSTQRRERAPATSGNALLNQRFATVVPSETFVHSQPVARAALKVAPEQIARAPVALVAAPPAPTASLALSPAQKPNDPKADVPVKPGAGASLPVAKTAVTDMPTLGKPVIADKPAAAPGPKIAPVATATPATPPPAPALAPRIGAAPPALKDDKAPAAPAKPTTEATAPNRTPVAPNNPAQPAKPDAKSDVKPEAKPAQGEAPKAASVPPPATPASPATPTVRPEAKPVQAEPPKVVNVPPPATPASPAPPTARPEAKPVQAEPPKVVNVPPPAPQATPASPATPATPQARPQPSVAAPAAPHEPNNKDNGARNTTVPAPTPAPAVSEAKPNEPKKNADDKK